MIEVPDKGEIELELYPLTLKILRHQVQSTVANRIAYTQPNTWSGMAGGYGAALGKPKFINTAKDNFSRFYYGRQLHYYIFPVSASSYPYSASVNTVPKRYVAHTATFSRLATIRQVYNYLCNRLKIRPEDVRLWKFCDEVTLST